MKEFEYLDIYANANISISFLSPISIITFQKKSCKVLSKSYIIFFSRLILKLLQSLTKSSVLLSFNLIEIILLRPMISGMYYFQKLFWMYILRLEIGNICSSTYLNLSLFAAGCLTILTPIFDRSGCSDLVSIFLSILVWWTDSSVTLLVLSTWFVTPTSNGSNTIKEIISQNKLLLSM